MIGRTTTAVLVMVASIGSVRAAEPPKVVVSIKPVHSLVAGVMRGAGEPSLLIETGASPHTYSLKPSQARALRQANAVFWVGPGLETFLEKPLAALPRESRVVALAEAPGLTLLPYRSGGPWEEHAADEPEEKHAHGHGHDHGHDHDHEAAASDMHVWLDADNARAMVRAVVATLSDLDPGRSALWQQNGAAVEARIGDLDARLRADLAALDGRPYVVFHDAYQYLEHRYGLDPAGSITVSPERAPSAKRVAEIRRKIAETGATCVFSEPQFEPKLVKTVIEGTTARTGVLDADGGMGIPPGPDAWFTLMTNLSGALRGCLAPAS